VLSKPLPRDFAPYGLIFVVHVDGVRQCVRIAASIGPIFHPQDDT
jgi:hypothetical protein